MPSNTPQRAEVAPFPGDCPESAAESPPGRCAYLGKRGRSTAVAVTLQSYHFHLFEGCEGQGGDARGKAGGRGRASPSLYEIEGSRTGSSGIFCLASSLQALQKRAFGLLRFLLSAISFCSLCLQRCSLYFKLHSHSAKIIEKRTATVQKNCI